MPMSTRILEDTIGLYRLCKKSNSKFILVLIRSIFYFIFYKKKIWAHQKAQINGIRNIESNCKLAIGLDYVGFIHKNDLTVLNINGKLILSGDYTIGRGCRIDIGKNGTLSIGKGGYINANSRFIVMHELRIGADCAISWDCQFLDEDFHKINYAGRKDQSNSIEIGNQVWIGCGAKIYKGSKIPDGCVIASDSVVKGVFIKENCLIGGNPAKIIKEQISWS
jgi:acetyltransferase-like isoleucine patch superfamily enzyme